GLCDELDRAQAIIDNAIIPHRDRAAAAVQGSFKRNLTGALTAVKDMLCADPDAQAAVDQMLKDLEKLKTTGKLTDADVVENYDRGNTLLHKRNPDADALRQQVEDEMDKHGISGQPMNTANDPQQPLGSATDVSNAAKFLDVIGSCCGAYRPYASDKVHYEPCPANCDSITNADQKARCQKNCGGGECLNAAPMNPGGGR